MPRRTGRAARPAIDATPVARCGTSAIAGEVNRIGMDRSIACADRRIDVGPCRAGCDRPCARQRRALRALLVAIGLLVSTDDDALDASD